MRYRHWIFASCALVAFQPAYAQDAGQGQSAENAGSSGGLEEILVTAQRREEDLQDVPIAISAVTANALQASGINDTESLGARVAGLNIQNTAGSSVPVIRGIGSANTAVGDESAVATYVDGVYRPFRVGNLFAFNSIERVEVLKGPQGALFGRNATGGVIQVITRDPSYEPTANFSVGYGRFETVTADAYVSTGVTETIAADLAVYYEDQGDGWGTNLVTGTDAYYSNEFQIRGKVRAELGERTSVTASVGYNRTDFNTPYRIVEPTVGFDGLGQPADFYDARANYEVFQKTKLYVGSLIIEHDLDFANLKSISSYQRLRGTFTPDNDATGIPVLNALLKPTGEAITQEIQLASAGNGPLNWIVGGFFMRNDTGYEPLSLSGLAFAGAPFSAQSINAVQETTSYSAFGQLSYAFTDWLTVVGGLRYTSDKQKLPYEVAFDGVVAQSGEREAKFDAISPRLVVELRPAEDSLIYASYNRGFKSGLFNTTDPFAAVIEPENLDAFEVGLKLEPSNRTRINVAAYYYDYSDFQQFQVAATGTTLLNAARVEIYGADAELEFAATDRLTINAGVSYIHGRYKDFDTAGVTTPNAPLPGNSIASPVPVDGNETVRTPEWQANAGFTWRPIDLIELAGNYSYSDSFFWDPDNRASRGSVNLLNASVNFMIREDSLALKIWGRNLLDEEYNAFVTALPFGDVGQPAAPLTYGATLSFKY